MFMEMRISKRKHNKTTKKRFRNGIPELAKNLYQLQTKADKQQHVVSNKNRCIRRSLEGKCFSINLRVSAKNA